MTALWAAEAPPVGGSWVSTVITIIGLVGGAGGVAALVATIMQRKKIKADAADVITDTALTLVEPLRARVTELEVEVKGARTQVNAAREQAEAAQSEIGDLRATVRELTRMLKSWRSAIVRAAAAEDPGTALQQLRVMVTAEGDEVVDEDPAAQRGPTRQDG
ncbi:hypothetical protein [Micromonospora sediminicola]|uniref:hypothetical protein n=1 Tax=Micromonospora sediminicola TaxID=946078 RepID=UPI003796855E